MSKETERVLTDAEIEAADRLAAKRLLEARAEPVDRDGAARVREYLRRPYRVEVRGNPEDGYLAAAPELPGCLTAGETPDEDRLCELTINSGIPRRQPPPVTMSRGRHGGLPLPLANLVATLIVCPTYLLISVNGRMLLRMPRSLHARLAEQAGREGVSINQLAVAFLAEGLGRETGGLQAEAEEIKRRSALFEPRPQAPG